jgi:hypothetical protein
MTLVGLLLFAIAWRSVRMCLQTSDEIWTVITGIVALICFLSGLFLLPLLLQLIVFVAVLYLEKSLPLLLASNSSNPK